MARWTLLLTVVVAMQVGPVPVSAQTTVQCRQGSNCGGAQSGSRLRGTGVPVPTNPSSHPFTNPLMQPLPPAASSNSYQQNTTRPIPTPHSK